MAGTVMTWHIVALSGGKDSTALALAEKEPRDGEWFILWRDYPEMYAEGEALEAYVTQQRNTPYTFRSPDRDAWPASLAALRREFEKGRVPERSLAIMDKRHLSGTCRVCTL